MDDLSGLFVRLLSRFVGERDDPLDAPPPEPLVHGPPAYPAAPTRYAAE